MTVDDVAELKRFTLAEENHGSFARAISELRAGRKTSHWIWWVFPQLAGLGTSGTATRYALSGRDEACAYLADEVLRSRLVEAVTAAHEEGVRPSGQCPSSCDHVGRATSFIGGPDIGIE